MWTYLDFDVINLILLFAELPTLFALRCCDRQLLCATTSVLHSIRSVPPSIRTDNVALLLRTLVNAKGWRTQLIPGAHRLRYEEARLISARHPKANFWLSSWTCSLRAIAHLVQNLEHPKLYVGTAREWKHALAKGRLRSAFVDVRASMLELSTHRDVQLIDVTKWIKLNQFRFLADLRLRGNIDWSDRLLRALPDSLWSLYLHHSGSRRHDAWIISDLFEHTHIEVCGIYGFLATCDPMHFEISRLMHVVSRIPCIVALDPFPLEAVRRCVERGSFVDVTSTFYADEEREARAVIREGARWAGL